MGKEINLMKNYPRTKRDIKQRGAEKTNKDRELARKFEKDFFDGSLNNKKIAIWKVLLICLMSTSISLKKYDHFAIPEREKNQKQKV